MPRRVTLRSWEKAWWPVMLLSLVGLTRAHDGFFKELVKTVEHDLGFDAVQELCNTRIEKESDDLNSTEDGLRLLNQVVGAVESKLDIMAEAIHKLRDDIEQVQNEESTQPNDDGLNSEADLLDCCKAGNKVKECIFQPIYSPPEERPKQFSDKLAKVIRQTHNQTLLSRQYYAKPNGAMITFPANRFSSCNDYDPRNRSWYFETATVQPKDVVVVVDTSRSMEVTHVHGRSLMELVKKGAQMVVNTLTSNDRVAVIGFSDGIATALENGCYSKELAVATPQNKRALSNFIESLRGKGLTNYVAALAKASQYFLPDANSSARDQILLFLSDGMPTAGGGEKEIMNTIQNDFNSKVRIMTFGIGKALQDQRNRQLLMNMSNINQSTRFFTEVNSSAQMVNSVADYYTREPTSEKRPPVFTLPYFDVGGNDFIMSVCLPVRNKSKNFNGVTCIDASINNLFKDIIDFKQGESSYAFLINNLGRVLLHPLLPKPSSLPDDIGLIDIGGLERDPAVQAIMAEMKKGMKGQKTIQAQQIVSRGDPSKEGVEAVWYTSTYAWAPIANTNFSVCVVFRSGEASPRFPQGYDLAFTFHIPTYKYWPPSERCLLNNRLVLKNKSIVQFPETFFKDQNVTEQDINNMTMFMRNQSANDNEHFRRLRDSAMFTADSQFWKNDSSSTVFVWRYLSTVDGVLRVYPGITLNKLYDVRQRSWYQRTLNNKGKLVFSGPYLDFWGAGYVVSISKAICKGGCVPYVTGRPLVSVIGGDVTIYHLYDLFIQNQPQCDPAGSCIIIDNSGYIVLHHDFIYPKEGLPINNNYSLHISVKEPEIAQTLVDENILQVKGCIDMLNSMKNKYFWQIPTFYNTDKHFENFNFYSIHHTNLFLIKKKTSISAKVSNPNVNCQFVSYLVNTTIGKEVVCKEVIINDQLHDCTCSSPSEFNHCKNRLDLYELSDFWPTCMPETANAKINMSYYNDPPTGESQPCTNLHCPAISNRSECRRHLGCIWCVFDSNGEKLENEHCIENSFCYYGILGHSGPNNEQGKVMQKPIHGIAAAWVAGISCLVAVPLLVIIIICIICIKRQRKKRFAPKQDSLPILLRTSLVDVGVDNPSLLWNPLDQSGSIGSKADMLTLHKMNHYSGSTTSGSIQHLTQKVEALVHHLENQSTLPSPLPLLGSRQYSSEATYPYYPRDNISIDSQSVYTRSSSRPTSMVSSIPSSPSTAHTSVSRPRPKPSSYHLPPSRTSSFRDRTNSTSRKADKQANEATHPPCTRQPSERTWPGEPIYPSHLGLPREPSERTCPCAQQHHHQCCNSRPSSLYSTRSQPSDWIDIRPDERHRPEVIPEVIVRRSSSFRHRRTPAGSSTRSNSARSRRSSSVRLSDDSIRAGILRLFQEMSSSTNLTGHVSSVARNSPDITEQQEHDEMQVVVENSNPKPKVS